MPYPVGEAEYDVIVEELSRPSSEPGIATYNTISIQHVQFDADMGDKGTLCYY